MSNLVELERASFSYDGLHYALNDVSLLVPVDKVTVILGSSGSGKTTLFKLITGQHTTRHGLVRVAGCDMRSISKADLLILRRNLGMLFQFGALFTDMSVYENIAFPLREHTKLAENMISKIVALKLHAVGLFGTQDLMPQELSGGMARRVALARASVFDPQIMLYDEPFTGLDPISVHVIAELIKKISDTLGQTSILVTHEITASLKIADYVHIMSQGRIIASGTPEEILNSNNATVKQFINGDTVGPIQYDYSTDIDYMDYLCSP
jgi:phospholipid/cholesterol/gamma-HCH transport system ATP-binding protein